MTDVILRKIELFEVRTNSRDARRNAGEEVRAQIKLSYLFVKRQHFHFLKSATGPVNARKLGALFGLEVVMNAGRSY